MCIPPLKCENEKTRKRESEISQSCQTTLSRTRVSEPFINCFAHHRNRVNRFKTGHKSIAFGLHDRYPSSANQTHQQRIPKINTLQTQYQQITEILTEKELVALAKKYGAQDQRKRKVPIRIFFWLMVLSASQPTVRGALFQLVAFFVSALSVLFPTTEAITLSKMALSLKLKQTNWYFFRAVYNRLLARYKQLLPPSQHRWLKHFRDAFILDATITRVHKALLKVFQSVHQDIAGAKVNVKYSLMNLAPQKVQVTESKRHDSRFRGITNESAILYLFDLGYWSFTRLKKIISAASFFVCRLKSNCDPLIVAVAQKQWQPLIGKRLSEIGAFLEGKEVLDVTVKLSKAKKPRFNDSVRLVGLLYEGVWRFWVTNIFDNAFTPQVIYDLYRQRWAVEIFFNYIKHLLHIEHLISRNKNGIMVEIYSALIFYLLTQIAMSLAAEKTGESIEAFSFGRSFQIVRAFLLTNLSRLLDSLEEGLGEFFDRIVSAIALLGLRDKTIRSP